MYREGRWQYCLTTRVYPQLSVWFWCLLVGDSFVFAARLIPKNTQSRTNSGFSFCSEAMHKVIVCSNPWDSGRDTPPLCSWLVGPFYPRLLGPGHWLEHCFSAHTALRGSDLNTSNNPARTSATAVEDWKHPRFLIIDTAEMREYIVLVV